MCVYSSDVQSQQALLVDQGSSTGKSKRVPEFRAEQLEWKCGLWGTLGLGRQESEQSERCWREASLGI